MGRGEDTLGYPGRDGIGLFAVQQYWKSGDFVV